MAERGTHSPRKDGGGDSPRAVRLARPTARTLPPPANDNPPRHRPGRILLPLALAGAALLLLLAGVAG